MLVATSINTFLKLRLILQLYSSSLMFKEDLQRYSVNIKISGDLNKIFKNSGQDPQRSLIFLSRSVRIFQGFQLFCQGL